MQSSILKDRRFLLLLIFFVVSVLGWAGGTFITLYTTSSPNIHINKAKFEKVLVEKQTGLQKSVIHLSEKYSTGGVSWDVLMDSLYGDEFSYFVYNKDTLIAWSDASIPVMGERDKITSEEVVKLKNGWYLAEHRKTKDVTIAGLFLIKREYPYENKFLKNRFNDCFNISSVPDIRTFNPGNGIDISGKNGMYLFTLVSGDKSFTSEVPSKSGLILILIAVLGSILFTGSLLRYAVKRVGNYAFVIVAGLLAMIYYGFVCYNNAFLTSAGDLFSPVSFAYSSLMPSLASILLLSFILFMFFFWIYRNFRVPSVIKNGEEDGLLITVYYALTMLIVMAYFLFVNFLIIILVQHSSSLSLYSRMSDFDVMIIAKVAIVVFQMFSFLFLLEKAVAMFREKILFWKRVVVLLLIVLFIGFVKFVTGCSCLEESIIFFFIITVIFEYVGHKKRIIHSYSIFTWIILLLSLYITIVLLKLYNNKEKRSREVLIENLSFRLVREEDPVAEMYLKGLEKYIETDKKLKELLRKDELSSDEIREYLEKKYFVGYLSRYELQIVPCWPGGDVVIRGTGETYNCYNYFDQLITKIGYSVNSSRHFYFMDNNNGNVTYMGMFSYFKGDPQYEVNLYIEINSKPVFVGLGYPELLKSDKEKLVFEVSNDYSYAKYVNGVLAKQFGEYEYDLSDEKFVKDNRGEKYYVETKEVSHLVYRPEENVLIVLTRYKISVLDIAIGFSIFFIGLFFLAVITLVVIKLKNGIPFFRFSIQERIQIALVTMVLVLLLIVGVSSVYYSIYQFKKKNSEILSQRLKSVLMEVEQKLGAEDSLTYEMRDYIQPLLQKFSNVFFCDINLFGLDGHLLATSRPELYVNGLTGRLMSPKAFYELSVNKKTEYEQEESIGGLNYVSAYVVIFNEENQPFAYLNIPYFVGSDELREQVSSLIVAVINAYLIFVLIAISFAVFVSRRITAPLSTIQNRLEKVSLSQKNEKIEYKKQDEIGELVSVYNRMVDELSESAAKLAQSEREVAWREMAKQIAHEIKNPLTPMKLNVQYLQRAWKDNVEDFDAYLEKVTNSLIEQIDQLSVIATEFSNFAKMPVAKRSKIDIVSKLKHTCELYKKLPDFEIIQDFDVDKPVWVFADPDQMIRVFNNIIKNAQQSIPKGKKGILNVKVRVDYNKVRISFADNGSGMSEEIKEKIFQPNFTTKSSGMGLGLAIVKNIITNSKGKIWFETGERKGTIFFIELPLYEEE
ncbi:MAG: HAMP domain-containing protein [Chlorobi bacterium]|nr:HAMP domain-containing protein [Chlorobiota bacterium]